MSRPRRSMLIKMKLPPKQPDMGLAKIVHETHLNLELSISLVAIPFIGPARFKTVNFNFQQPNKSNKHSQDELVLDLETLSCRPDGDTFGAAEATKLVDYKRLAYIVLPSGKQLEDKYHKKIYRRLSARLS